MIRTQQSALSTRGMWPWVLQRVTGALLIGLLGLHFWVTHFGTIGPVTFENVLERVKLPLWFFVDLALLAVIIYHALNGVRTIVLDFGLSPRKALIFDWLLVILGMAMLVFGYWGLVPFQG
jgi:succinate dehydrogenase cytochrome b556 subunit